MKKFLLSLVCAFVALGMNATTVVDLYKDFTTAQNINWGSDAANARISFSATDGLVYSSTEATTNNWDAQYWIANGNAFESGNTYTLTLMIKGSVEGVIGNIKLGDWGQGVDNYGKVNIPVGEFKEVSIEVSGVTGGDGILVQTGSYVGELCIKWAKITHEDNRDTSKFCLALTDIPAGANPWDHQLQYPFDPAIPAGKYQLTLDVMGDAAGSMSIWGDYVEGANYGPGLDFGTSWETKTVDFELSKDYKQFALVFGQYTGKKIYFDNIKITNVDTNEDVVSADFSSGTLDGFKVSGFWTGSATAVAKASIIEATEDMGEPEPEPEPWVCPEGEIDITTLEWVKNDQDCIIDFGENKGNIFGTDSGNGNISYADVSSYETIKVYGKAGSVVRAFFNRNEAANDGKDFIFVFDAINEDGVATFDLAKVVEKQGDYGHMYLNGIKAGPNYNSVATVYGITVSGEAPEPTPKDPETYTIKTTAGKIGTVALDYPATIEGATLYEVVGFSETEGLAIAEVEGDMVGGTPYIYIAEADEVVCTQTGKPVAHGDFDCTEGKFGNGLVGCYSEVSPSTGWFGFIRTKYIISNAELRQISNGNVTIPANRCFFDPDKCTSNSMSSAKMVIAPAEDATAIKNVNAALEGGKIYDMNGREVKSMQKGGIYVVGGMKISVK